MGLRSVPRGVVIWFLTKSGLLNINQYSYCLQIAYQAGKLYILTEINQVLERKRSIKLDLTTSAGETGKIRYLNFGRIISIQKDSFMVFILSGVSYTNGTLVSQTTLDLHGT